MIHKGFVVALTTVVILIGGCGGDDAESGTDTGTDTGGSESVSLTAAEFAFDPSELSAPAGSTIEFTNADEAPHTFTAEDAGLDVDVEAGGSATIDLADVEPGTYDFLCTIHPDTMTGTLEVTE